ncbi:DUF1097 domain-containing protein [Microbulbifer sp. VAAC004]|uniref:DUF1097 domain-containing protein n=1 Tax=unclassified Microbulbifer TaxID=2619833 RepID=UPI00403AF3A0
MNSVTESLEHSNGQSQERLFTGLRIFLSASLAIVAAQLVGVPSWVAALGAVTYFARGGSLRSGGYNLACAVTGLGLGLVAIVGTAGWQLEQPWLALPMALLLSAIGAWAMGLVTGVGNIISYGIGILIAFTAQQPISLDGYFLLITAAVLGAIVAGLVDFIWPGKLFISGSTKSK